jgi:nitronate monooxygenase
VIAERIPVVSFTFGAPDRSIVERLCEVGSEVVVTVTTPQEARIAADPS